MSIDPGDSLLRLRDHARALGVFEVCRASEFKSAPPKGLCFAVWGQRLGVSPVGSGLGVSAAVLRCTARIYLALTHRPEDEIDVKVFGAAAGYLGRINGGFTLGGTVRNVDILGEADGRPEWEAGHVNIDNQLYRVADLQMAVIYNDAWEQVA